MTDVTTVADVASKSSTIFLTDRSAVELDDKCGRAYFWNRKYAGKGIVPKVEAVALQIGRETHTDLQTVAEMEDISPAALQAACDDLAAGITPADWVYRSKMELLYRRMGWLVAFALYIEPGIRARYENVAIEQEIVLDRDPLWVVTTPDRLLRDRLDGHLEYREYKTTISASFRWMRSWQYAIQLHIGLAAAQEEHGHQIKFAQIMGLRKGYESAADHCLNHPYTWAYYNPNTDQWTHDYDRAKGGAWVKRGVWEYPHGIVAWVQLCGAEVGIDQFPHSQPVFYNKRMLDEWVVRRLHRERMLRNIEAMREQSLFLSTIHYEKRTQHCSPAYGFECPYMRLCWNAEAELDPLATGDYEVRTPHHEMEIIGIADV